MLKMTVPTCAKGVGGVARLFALIANTSRSGSENLTPFDQLRPRRSRHWLDPMSNLTMRPVSGPVTFSTFLFGAGKPPGY